MGERRRLINIAYRLLGSVADADGRLNFSANVRATFDLRRPISGRVDPAGRAHPLITPSARERITLLT